jgi:predicted O-methyltransferase YrrM/uncharacterized protein YndB with AHSA1/START domain
LSANELWDKVDRYFDERLAGEDAVLTEALAASERAGLPHIQVAPNQGRLLMLLAKAIGARRILEVGTLGGYSAIHLARALPSDGQLISLEIDPRHADVALGNLANAGLAHLTEVRVGAALSTLPLLEREGVGPFDLVFIDADKPSNADYFAWALRLTRPGSLIIVDNVVRSGQVASDASSDENVLGVHRLVELLAHLPRVQATALQTVGLKGHDGLIIAVVGAAEAAPRPDCELVNARLVRAPRSQVWQMWTDPVRLSSWWGPKGITTTVAACDIRAGGSWRYTEHGPDGIGLRYHWQIVEVSSPDRIVLEHLSSPRVQLTVTFAEHGSDTRLVQRMLFPSAESCGQLAGFTYEANERAFDRLEVELGIGG